MNTAGLLFFSFLYRWISARFVSFVQAFCDASAVAASAVAASDVAAAVQVVDASPVDFRGLLRLPKTS